MELVHPRKIKISTIKTAYLHGMDVLNTFKQISPIFLLRGYSSFLYGNRMDSLNNLWIFVEQLISFLWKRTFVDRATNHPKDMEDRIKSFKTDNRTWSMAVKLELLWQTKNLSEECYRELSQARKARNRLAHEGAIPDHHAIKSLWNGILELLEGTSNVGRLGLRQLLTLVHTPTRRISSSFGKCDAIGEIGSMENTNFDEWVELSNILD